MRLHPWKANGLTLQAFQLRSSGHYALHPVEAALQYHGASAEGTGAACDASVGFEQAEGVYRAGSQGLRLSEIPQLPQQLRELSRLSTVDRAGRKALRSWAADVSLTIHEADFLNCWETQGRPGGAEHQVYHDKDSNRWLAYLHPVTGLLAHDLHDENVVRLPETGELAVIDPYISLSRRGTWAAIKLAEIGFPTPDDDPPIQATPATS